VGVSTVIGKDAVPPAPVGAAREVTKQIETDRDARAARFRAALAQMDSAPAAASQVSGHAPPQAGKAGEFAPRFKLHRHGAEPRGADRNKPTMNQPGGAAAREAAQREKERACSFPATKPRFLDDQAMLGAMYAAETGVATVGGKGKPGQGGAGAFSEELALAGPGGAAALEKDTKPKMPGESAIAELAAAVSAAAAVPGAHQWARPEGPTHATPRARELPRPLSGGDPVHQLLIGKGPSGAEARMVISVGPLAGTTIHLKEGPAGIQAAILTQTATARQTLSSAMGAAAQRLKTKGHRLEVRFGDSARAGDSLFERADSHPSRG
jgi:hypothetical protein